MNSFMKGYLVFCICFAVLWLSIMLKIKLEKDKLKKETKGNRDGYDL